MFEIGDQRRDFGAGLRRRAVAFGKGNGLDVGRALADRLEGLALETRCGRHPEGVDGISQQQNLDIAGAEPFQLRADGETLGVFAGQIIDRGLVFSQVLDVSLERAVAVGMRRRR